MNKTILILLIILSNAAQAQEVVDPYGALIRSDTTKSNIYLCFTGHDFDDGFDHVLDVLENQEVKASFFLTGEFIRQHKGLVKRMAAVGHFVGAHSDKHLLYNDWTNRDSLIVSRAEIRQDICDNLKTLDSLELQPGYFMPPYECYNHEVVEIAAELGQITINFTPGIRTNADYTTPEMPNYLSSAEILEGLYRYEEQNGIKGFHILIHPGTSPARKDKLYLYLEDLIAQLRSRGYRFMIFD